MHPNTTVYYRYRRWDGASLAKRLKLKWRKRPGLRARSIVAYLPKHGPLRLVVTRNRHGNREVLVTNDLDSDLTTIVLRKRSRWSIETLFRDAKQFSGLAACRCRVDQALVRHVAFVMIAFVVLQRLRRHPKETLGEVKDRLHRFAHLFARSEPREQAAKYMRGLLAPVQRRNGWQVAEAVGDVTPDRTQRLLYRAKWDADAARDELQAFVVEMLGHSERIGVIDETGFLKKGTQSVGVQRQYTGTAGKVENCQIGVFLVYVTPKGQTFLDRRLYLPREWCEDMERRRRAKVPDEVRFQTKPELAIAMLQHAWERGVPMRWVTGDEAYGNTPKVREAIRREEGHYYVLAVSSSTPVWRERPAVEPPTRDTGDRPRTKPRLAEGAPAPTTVAAVVAAWPEQQWQRLTVTEGEKGPRTYDWAWARVVESRDGLPGPDAWLLARRSLSDPTDLAYYLSNAPPDTPLLTLAQVASSRYPGGAALAGGSLAFAALLGGTASGLVAVAPDQTAAGTPQSLSAQRGRVPTQTSS